LEKLSTSSLWIAICSFFRPACLALILGVPFDWRCGLAVALATFGVYLIDKVSDSAEDLLNTPGRAWLAKYRREAKILAIGSYAASLILTGALIDIWKVPYLLVFGSAGVIYTRNIHGFRPKDLPGAKTVIVAGASAICYAGMISGPIEAYVLAFLTIAIDTIIFDLRDIIGDRAAGVRTLPVLVGRNGVLLLLIVLDIITIAMSPAIATYGAFLIWFFRKERDSLCYDYLVDAWMMWVYLGLQLLQWA